MFSLFILLNICVFYVLGQNFIESAGILINYNVFGKFQVKKPLQRRSILIDSFLENTDKESVLNHHNYYRNLTASGSTSNQPLSTNMNELFWDKGLEVIATKYAAKCSHNHNNKRISELNKVKDFVSWKYDIDDITIGEAMYIGKHNDVLEGALHGIDLFYQENIYYNYQTAKCDENAKWNTCDHYKQIVYADTRYVGCGLNQCDVITIDGINYKNVINFVCNYFPSFSPNQIPYKSNGDICSECDIDRICGKFVVQKDEEVNMNALCSGCLSDSFIYCKDSSDLCQKVKPQCNSSITLQKLCKTSCDTCYKQGIDGYKSSKCCSNGIDDKLKCPISNEYNKQDNNSQETRLNDTMTTIALDIHNAAPDALHTALFMVMMICIIVV